MMHSQNSEEKIISDFFGDHIGTFLDLGANNGIDLSNTYALTLKGWSGALVDASPAVFGRLRENLGGNEKLDLLNYAVGSYDGTVILHESGELLGKGDISLVSSTREDEVRRWDSLSIRFKDVEVDMLSFTSLLAKTRYKKFDLVSIDIEGNEVDVVPQIDFGALGTRMAIIEFNGKHKDFFSGIMAKYDMPLVHENQENLVFAK